MGLLSPQTDEGLQKRAKKHKTQGYYDLTYCFAAFSLPLPHKKLFHYPYYIVRVQTPLTS